MTKRISATVGRVIGMIVVSILIFLAILFGYLAGSMVEIAKEAPKINTSTLLSDLNQNSKIVDGSGSLIEQLETAEYREVVPYQRIPKNLVNAFVHAEDKRFWDHDGVDFWGILSAVRGFFSSGDLRGASTITMQLARNLYLNYDVNWARKIQEMYLAAQIEKELSKEQIMEAYLNRVFFGQNAYGVQAASKIYFSKDVQDLDLAQCATIASIVPAPSQYSLYSTYRPSQVTNERVLGETSINGQNYVCVYNPPAYKRSKYVLKQMLDHGAITQAQYSQASKEDVAATIKPPAKRAENISTYLTDLIKDQAVTILMDSKGISYKEARQLLFTGGLTIHSTVDVTLQQQLQNTFAHLGKVINNGNEGALNLKVNYDAGGNIVSADKNLLYYKRSNLLTKDNRVVIPKAQFKVNNDGSVTFQPGRLHLYSGYLSVSDFYTIDENGALRTHQVSSIPLDGKYVKKGKGGSFTIQAGFLQGKTPFYQLNPQGNMVLDRSNYTIDEEGILQPQAAMTVLDSKTGEVRAIVGGREQEGRHFLNRAAKLPRQPGSSIKPIAEYSAAFGMGFNQASAQDDSPFSMIDDKPWPVNVDNRYRGLTTIRDALIRSSNPVAVKWLNQLGVKAVKDYLTRYGIINADHPDRDNFIEAKENPNRNDEIMSMAIGGLTHGLTTLDMAGAYQSIANEGKHIAPMAISRIEDSQGNVVYENTHKATQVLTPQQNYQLRDVLQAIVKEGYVRNVLQPGSMDLFGKTGTTNENKDFWFCGGTPYYTTAIWYGAENGFLSLTGDSNIAGRIYNAVHQLLHQDKKTAQFPVPDGITTMELCSASGKLPGSACKYDSKHPIIKVPVATAEAPTDTCDVHVFRSVDVRNNLLAKEGTPGRLTVNRVFTQRPIVYDPQKFKGIVPEDWGWEVPRRYSDLAASPIQSEVKGTDGTQTTRTIGTDGTITEVTKYPDGHTVTRITRPDGTTQETSTQASSASSASFAESSSSEASSSSSSSSGH